MANYFEVVGEHIIYVQYTCIVHLCNPKRWKGYIAMNLNKRGINIFMVLTYWVKVMDKRNKELTSPVLYIIRREFKFCWIYKQIIHIFLHTSESEIFLQWLYLRERYCLSSEMICHRFGLAVWIFLGTNITRMYIFTMLRHTRQ